MRLGWYPGWRDNDSLDGLKESMISQSGLPGLDYDSLGQAQGRRSQ